MRTTFASAYTSSMVRWLMMMRGMSEDDATKFVKHVANTRFQDRKMTMIQTDDKGDVHPCEASLRHFIDSNRDQVLTPNGCVYKRSDVEESHTSKFVKAMLAQRKVHKKAMLKAKATGDSQTERYHHYAQASIKILLNSLPGGMGSAYNIFYDNGGYNAITALGRSLITTAWVTAEQIIGGNFAWFTENEVVNYILLNMNNSPDNETIDRLVMKYHLHHITHDELFLKLERGIRPYVLPSHPLALIRETISHLTQTQCTYLYYLQDLRALIMEQDQPSRAFFQRLFDMSQLSTDGIDPNDLFKLDETVMAVATPQFMNLLEGHQVYDLPTKAPEKAKLYVSFVRHLQSVLSEYEEMFKVFIFTPTTVPISYTKPGMRRNTIIISDTDSEFVTAKDWVQWYTGSVNESPGAYQITSMVIYWLTICTAHELRKWSKIHGCAANDLGVMNMKNEFVYTTILLYAVKKVYAGIVSMTEGVVLPKPKIDIKGGLLRSSSMCKDSIDFVSSTLVNQILKPSLSGRISATALVHHTMAYEDKIKRSIEAGETQYLRSISINPADSYKQPQSSVHMYWVAWEAMFAPEIGHITLPSKAPIVVLNKPTADYFKWLKEKHPVVAERWEQYIKRYGKSPTGIMLDQAYNRIPEALIPLIDIRGITYYNITPVYSTLELLGIASVHEKQKVLLSDIYSAQ